MSRKSFAKILVTKGWTEIEPLLHCAYLWLVHLYPTGCLHHVRLKRLYILTDNGIHTTERIYPERQAQAQWATAREYANHMRHVLQGAWRTYVRNHEIPGQIVPAEIFLDLEDLQVYLTRAGEGRTYVHLFHMANFGRLFATALLAERDRKASDGMHISVSLIGDDMLQVEVYQPAIVSPN